MSEPYLTDDEERQFHQAVDLAFSSLRDLLAISARFTSEDGSLVSVQLANAVHEIAKVREKTIRWGF